MTITTTRFSHHLRWMVASLILLFFSGLQKASACDVNDPSCQDNLGCNDQVNVTLGDDCTAIVTPDMVLEGNFGCLVDHKKYFKIRIIGDDADETNETHGETTVDGCGRFIYDIIFDHEAFCNEVGGFKVNFPLEGCWGYINAEDKTPPVFECEQETIESLEVDVNAQQYAGTTGAPALDFGNYSCFIDVGVSTANCQRGYKVINNVSSNEDAVYTFYLDMPGAPGTVAIYQGAFDPESPCSNIVAQSSTTYLGTSTLTNGLIRISLPMKADAVYAILVTTYDDVCSSNEPFDLFAYSDDPDAELANFGGFTTKKVLFPLLCSDVDRILNSDALIPGPEVLEACTNCGSLETWFEDVLTENGDCGGQTISRTWYTRDASGNNALTTCTQTIQFRNTRLTDVVRPPTTVPIECDENFPLDEEGHPHPSFTGYPFVATAWGIRDLNESFCNVGATYRDISNIEICAGAYKIVREWTIIDWCYVPGQYDLNNSPLINYRQIIKVGDFSGPELLDVPETLIFSTGPFNCTAAFSIPDIEIQDNCSEANISALAKIYLAVKQPVYDKYGNVIDEVYEYVYHTEAPIGGYVSGIPLSDPDHPHKMVFEAIDGCDNESESELYFVVKDQVEPVAVCDDDLNISIGGEGIGRIRAVDVDEGSWDNCELATILISRKLIDEDRRDAYLQEVYGYTFSQLEESAEEDPSGQDAVIWVLKSDPTTQVLRYKQNRWFTWWGEDIWFICGDMNEEVTIELVAIDISGNANVCWLDVFIEDKINPYCQAPAPVTFACDELPYGFDPEDDAQLEALFGTALATDNCPGATAQQIDRSVLNWECNSGTIIRYFEATDAKGRVSTNTCKQEITVYRVHDYVIKFPADAELTCNAESPDTLVELTERACDLLSLNVYDERFTASGDACYKIKRTFKVINWCQYDGEGDPMIIGRDEDDNNIVGDKEVYVIFTEETRNVPGKGEYFTYVDEDDDPFAKPPAEYHYRRTPFDNGYYQYSQFIKIIDDVPPVIVSGEPDPFCSIDNNDCSAAVSIPLEITDACSGDEIEVKVFLLPDATTGLPAKLDLQNPDNAAAVNFGIGGSYPNYTLNGRFPLGDHAFEIHVVDGCQNSILGTIPFQVVDCKAPAPICINGLALELMPTEDGGGAMEIWASDFKVSNLEDCSEEVRLSINRKGETPDINNTALLLTCDDPDTLAVEIYAWDSADNPYAVQPDGSTGGPNYDFCLTYIIVQDNMFDLCDPAGPAAVGGLIVDEYNQTLENAEVSLSGGMENNMTTNADGFYAFTGLDTGYDYTVTPHKNDDLTNGVSTFDIVLITKHILGTSKLNNPYKLIAADVNASGKVTALDLIHLRKVVLSVSNAFPSNTSWRFVPASYLFEDGTNPWKEDFPEILNFNDLQGEDFMGDFIAIKTGDINGNAIPNQFVAEQRSMQGTFELQIENQKLQAGNEYRIPFQAADMANVQGYQFTLNYEGLKLLDIEYGNAQAENFGMLGEGVITTSWNGVPKDPHLFTLVVLATQDAALSDLLKISSRYTQAEAYNSADELMDVALSFENGRHLHLQDAFHLEQNQPNPFQGQTMIGFILPKAAQATLSIQDVTGKTLKLIRGDYHKGYNQIQLNSSDLPLTGVLYYTLKTGEFTATKKMVVIE